jgi:prepilin-type N-terminal cleavage/methylation domain-containing protein
MSRRRRGRTRGGFTLIEVLVALVILSTAMMSISSYISNLGRTSGLASVRATAGDLVAARLELIKADLNYAALESTFVQTESEISGHPGFERETRIVHTLSPTVDYKTVTVIVTAPALPGPVKKTTVINSF